MLVWLDEVIDRYARLVLWVADFLGIHERLLILIWIVTGSMIWAAPLARHALTPVNLLFGLAMAGFLLINSIPWVQLMICMQCQARMLGITRAAPTDEGRRRRTKMLLLLQLLSLLHFGPWLSWWPTIVVFKALCPLYLYMWFMDHPGRRRPKRLREYAKELKEWAKKIFLPNPAPTLAPEPTPV